MTTTNLTETETTTDTTDTMAWLTEEPVTELDRRLAEAIAARQAREAADPHAVEAILRTIKRAAEKRDAVLAELQGGEDFDPALVDLARQVSSLDETLMGLHALLDEAREEENGAMFPPAYHAEQMAERR